MLYNVVVIGGGASGLCTSIAIKRSHPKLSVLIIERLQRLGKKLAATGNGRCNISNTEISLDCYHGENVYFAKHALEKYPLSSCEEFFLSLGVPFINEGNKVYPASLQAASVVDALRFECDRLGIDILTETLAKNIQNKENKYLVETDNKNFECENLILAGGLFSGGEKLGCDGNLLASAKRLGLKCVDATPSIVQLKTENQITKQLKGIKINALAMLKVNNETVRREYGEILFCDYGLSGPPILQISREASRTDKKELCVLIDIFPNTTFEELVDILSKRKALLSYRKNDEFFTGMLNKRLGQVILKCANIPLNDFVERLTLSQIKSICSHLKNFKFKVIGTTGFINSQVSAGGLATNGFDEKTMMSKKHKNLFAIGEILDIDGDCGGFNLQWAFSSAMCAAECIDYDNNK